MTAPFPEAPAIESGGGRLMQEFRALLECRQDPCPYCGGPALRFPVEPPSGPYDTEDAAREHGQAQARNVYGSHRVIVEAREVGPWQETR